MHLVAASLTNHGEISSVATQERYYTAFCALVHDFLQGELKSGTRTVLRAATDAAFLNVYRRLLAFIGVYRRLSQSRQRAGRSQQALRESVLLHNLMGKMSRISMAIFSGVIGGWAGSKAAPRTERWMI